MKERPILFQGAMVRALLDGSKTQTRRVVKLPHMNPLGEWEATEIGGPDGGRTAIGATIPLQGGIWHTRTGEILRCPHGQPGDRLWVRETVIGWETHTGQDGVWYPADGGFMPIENTQAAADAWLILRTYRGQRGAKVPGIHMPRWACRIQLEIVSVRVERLAECGDNDAKAEGVTIEDRHMNGYCAGEYLPPSVRAYRDLWESINGADSWAVNPWVWVVEFKRVKK